MTKLFLIAEIAENSVAICSDFIESVVTVGEVVDVPRCDPVVAGLFALRSRVLTLIDCQYRITGQRKPIEQEQLAVVASIGGHSFGLLVDRVDDVVSVNADTLIPVTKLDPKWLDVVSELIEIDGKLVMVVNPEQLVAIEDRLAA
ncbi:MAG: chemotaxis protein CheW [Sphingomonadales bacterium]|jgi:purine-binding chemotaxis protein CheW|nr:chemotaxis protein CheW [Sphingomonadales bacterium]MBK9003774.1 chemotaxis protein CheW [Sphingomonadales bacterium]MBK9268948.1 chemotaxis protein CheW [Sphingomonadales bacterium]